MLTQHEKSASWEFTLNGALGGDLTSRGSDDACYQQPTLRVSAD
jgi:hypothetical protein